ncbi:uncharacterized protein LOC105848295 [Hydra vulgaris]|uniref:Uncharacterized protein LOC105848295 n=1 Tax=Hydra vulgaris TaxID=6087 RepID=A0ABM4BFB5_HYDVU
MLKKLNIEFKNLKTSSLVLDNVLKYSNYMRKNENKKNSINLANQIDVNDKNNGVQHIHERLITNIYYDEMSKFAQNKSCGQKNQSCMQKKKYYRWKIKQDQSVLLQKQLYENAFLLSSCKDCVQFILDQKNSTVQKLTLQKMKNSSDLADKTNEDRHRVYNELELKRKKNDLILQGYIKKHYDQANLAQKSKKEYEFAVNFSCQSNSITNAMKKHERSKFKEGVLESRLSHVKHLKKKASVKKSLVKSKQMDLLNLPIND